MYLLNSSLRVKPAFDTFQVAKEYFQRLGISRVTETTRLDSIGIPVAIAIRPSAEKGSLIVTAGKGLAAIEAKTGAAMESIEIAFSEVKNSNLSSNFLTAKNILNSEKDPEDILRLCPQIEKEIDLNTKMSMVKLADILSTNQRYIPSELLFIPFTPQLGEAKYFGYHTNGLASGNSYSEAIIHAIFEIVERDILSFEFVKEDAYIVSTSSLPENVQDLIRQIENEGLEVIVKTVMSSHQIPFFKAYIMDKWAAGPTNVNAGYGCHGNREISLMRALSEAAQSRMSYIHGGREDLTKGLTPYLDQNQDLKLKNEALSNSIKSSNGHILYDSIRSIPIETDSLDDYLAELILHIRKMNVIQEIYVARHTLESEPIQVVKVVIPDMEFYNNETLRIGPRLHQYIQNLDR